MKFKSSFIVLIVFLFFFSFKQDDKDIIIWKESRPLTWNDFKGKPQKRFAAASTNYNILKSISKANDKSATIKIDAVFFCQRSWKKTNWVNESVLTHEQKHFDIVELFSRKLRKTIEENKYRSYDDAESKIEEFYTSNDKAMDIYQDQYDDETDGSMNGDKQREWNKKIISEIAALKKYEEPAFTITFP